MHVSIRGTVAALGSGAVALGLAIAAGPVGTATASGATAGSHSVFHASSVHTASAGHLVKVGSGSLLGKPPAGVAHQPTQRSGFRVNRYFGHRSTARTHVSGAAVAARPTVSNFDGVSIADNDTANGFELEPPDQGLCVAPNIDPSTGISKVVYEHVNLALSLYFTDGTLYNGPFASSTIFQEDPSEFLSDPRCVYDADTGYTFMTALAINPDFASDSHNDITVIGPDLFFTTYRYDTTDAGTAGCPCFADQPYLGYDRWNLYVGGNEFNLAGTAYYGGEVYAIDKAAMAAGDPAPNIYGFTHLKDSNGVPTVTTQPAQTLTGTGPEYLMDTYVADASGNNIPSSNKYGVFAITNQANVPAGSPPTLLGPTTVNGPTYSQPLTSPGLGGALLDAGDDRLQQVEFANGKLYSSVGSSAGGQDVAVAIRAVPKVVGSTVKATVTGTTVSAPGADLLFPAVFATPAGAQALVGTVNSPTTPPSAGYATKSAPATATYSSVGIAAAGNGPDTGFTCTPPNGPPCRWGDYSAATYDPTSRMLWMATEYIPPPAEWGTFANWGTRVFSVRG